MVFVDSMTVSRANTRNVVRDGDWFPRSSNGPIVTSLLYEFIIFALIFCDRSLAMVVVVVAVEMADAEVDL